MGPQFGRETGGTEGNSCDTICRSEALSPQSRLVAEAPQSVLKPAVPGPCPALSSPQLLGTARCTHKEPCSRIATVAGPEHDSRRVGATRGARISATSFRDQLQLAEVRSNGRSDLSVASGARRAPPRPRVDDGRRSAPTSGWPNRSLTFDRVVVPVNASVTAQSPPTPNLVLAPTQHLPIEVLRRHLIPPSSDLASSSACSASTAGRLDGSNWSVRRQRGHGVVLRAAPDRER